MKLRLPQEQMDKILKLKRSYFTIRVIGQAPFSVDSKITLCTGLVSNHVFITDINEFQSGKSKILVVSFK